jgi:hypothetical protein
MNAPTPARGPKDAFASRSRKRVHSTFAQFAIVLQDARQYDAFMELPVSSQTRPGSGHIQVGGSA